MSARSQRCGRGLEHEPAPYEVLKHKSGKVALAPSTTADSGIGLTSLTANAVKDTGEQRNGTLLEFPLTDRLTAKRPGRPVTTTAWAPQADD